MDSERPTRVTRNSSRMGSVESLNDIDLRNDTPVVKPRSSKITSLAAISESSSTPTLGRSTTDSPMRRTRQSSLSESEGRVASPFRRTTRATSQEKDITASPLPKRATRRSLVNDSEDDDAQNEPSHNRLTRRNARKSLAAEKIIEEDENQEEISKTPTLTADELELRNRSISKSPHASPKTSVSPNKSAKLDRSLDESSSNLVIDFDALNQDDEDVEGEEKPRKFFKSRDRFSKNKIGVESKTAFEKEDLPTDESIIKTFSSKKKRKSDEEVGKNGDDKPDEEQKEEKSFIDGTVSPTKALIRPRRSIHEEEKDEIEELIKDFVPDTPKTEVKKVSNGTPKDSKKPETPKNSAKVAQVIEKTPKSLNKSVKSSIETPKTAEKLSKTSFMTPKTAEKSIKASVATPKTAEKSIETPKTAEKSSKSSIATPKSAKSTPKQSNGTKEVIEVIETPKSTQNSSAKSPKSAKKSEEESIATPKSDKKSQSELKTPQSAVKESKKTPKKGAGDLSTCDMDISQQDESDMEISPDKNAEKPSTKLTSIMTDRKTINIADLSRRRTLNETEDSKTSPQKIMRKSLGNLTSANQNSEEQKAETPEKTRRSWNVSVLNTSKTPIDASHGDSHQEVIVSDKTPRRKSISSDESEDDEDDEKNSFVDDEAEVGSEESLSESEKEYLKNNELPDDGESIGSQDSNELEEHDEDEEEADGSFIDDGEVSDSYSMDSHEEKVEEVPKRKSRIIVQSSSEDEGEAEETKSTKVVEEVVGETSGADKEDYENEGSDEEEDQEVAEKEDDEGEVDKDEVGEEQEVEEEVENPEKPENSQEILGKSSAEVKETPTTEQIQKDLRKKRKRETNELNESVRKIKRVKLNETGNESGIAGLFEQQEDSQEEEIAVEPPKKIKKKVEKEFNVEAIKSKADELMNEFNELKRAKKALKREKKALELAKKKQLQENLDSSNGENKENAPKKKKKKTKKQKPVDDTPEKKDNMATAVSKLQEKEEKRRQKKLLKKQAKKEKEQQQQSVDDKKEEVKVAEPEKLEKKSKKQKVEPQVDLAPTQEVKPAEVADQTSKKSKRRNAEPFVDVLDLMSVSKIEAQPEKKKKKTQNAPEPEVEVKMTEEVPDKKSKKRKLEEDPQPEEKKQKKKLKILEQVEDSSLFNRMKSRDTATAKQADPTFAAPLASQKIKKVLPQTLKQERNKKKKKSGQKRVIPEPKISPPRPIWTSSGVFIEEPVEPYKFQPTSYVPIRTDASTQFGVVAFEAKKQKKSTLQQTQSDFKTQTMQQRHKMRDGSAKNYAGLMPSRSVL